MAADTESHHITESGKMQEKRERIKSDRYDRRMDPAGRCVDFAADTGISSGRLDDRILEGSDLFGRRRLVLDCDGCCFCADSQNKKSRADSRAFPGCGSADYQCVSENAVARIRPYDLYPAIELLVENRQISPFPPATPAHPLQLPLFILRCFRRGREWERDL